MQKQWTVAKGNSSFVSWQQMVDTRLLRASTQHCTMVFIKDQKTLIYETILQDIIVYIKKKHMATTLVSNKKNP